MSVGESAEEKKRKADDRERSKQIEKIMSKGHQSDQQISKLLLLGAGESGKSTLFKQMDIIYKWRTTTKGYPESERKTFAPIIYNNIITAMKILCHQSDNYKSVTPQNAESRTVVEELKGDEIINQTIAGHIKALWDDEGIKKTFENRAKFQLIDSAKYYFGKIDEIAKDNYIPTEQDVLRSRVRTTGIVENAFDIDGNQFKMFDVGGQRNERKKWIHCFEDVTAVLFVAAISEYDQVLYEDENTNRMVEALNLFEVICKYRFRETSMILFLNKCDLFKDKIKRGPLSKFFEFLELFEFREQFEDRLSDGLDPYDAGCELLQMLFENRTRREDRQERQVYTHITCATNTNNIKTVFEAVKDIIIKKSLNEAGLV